MIWGYHHRRKPPYTTCWIDDRCTEMLVNMPCLKTCGVTWLGLGFCLLLVFHEICGTYMEVEIFRGQGNPGWHSAQNKVDEQKSRAEGGLNLTMVMNCSDLNVPQIRKEVFFCWCLFWLKGHSSYGWRGERWRCCTHIHDREWQMLFPQMQEEASCFIQLLQGCLSSRWHNECPFLSQDSSLDIFFWCSMCKR